MKKNHPEVPKPTIPSEDEIRDYAYHLYCQSGRVEGNDVKNWLEAETYLCSCLTASPKTKAPKRVPKRASKRKAKNIPEVTSVASIESRNLGR